MTGEGSFCFGVFLVFKKFFCWCCFGGFFYFHRHSFLPVIRGHQARESGSGSSQAMFSVFWMVHTGMAWSTVLGLSKYSSRGRWEMSRKEFLLFPFVNVFLLSIRLLRVLRVTEKTKIWVSVQGLSLTQCTFKQINVSSTTRLIDSSGTAFK